MPNAPRAAARLAAAAMLAVLLAPAAVRARCLGDCNCDGRVTIDEIIRGLNIALGNAPLSACDAAFGSCPGGPVCIDGLIGAVNSALAGCPPIVLPALAASDPPSGAANVPRTAWIRLTFTAAVNPNDYCAVQIGCGQVARRPLVSAIQPNVLVANPPDGWMPAGERCDVFWPGADPVVLSTAPAGHPAVVLYDRTDARRTTPFPDDFWLVTDDAMPTGRRVAMPVPPGPPDVVSIFTGLLEETNALDGFSPIGHFVVELSDAPDVSTLPLTAAQSLDPLATVGLFDVTPAGAGRGRRVPFLLQARTDTSVTGVVAHTLLVFPSIPLDPRGRYALVITRRALVDPSRPVEGSAFFQSALAPATAGEPEALARVRDRIDPVLDVLARDAVPPIQRDDVALVVPVSVRSTDAIPDDMLAVKAQVLAAPPATVEIAGVQTESAGSPLAAVVRGTWQAPEYRDGGYFARDEAGQPVPTGSKPVAFTLALPKAALDGPVPVVMYQHGNPGSAEAEVPGSARRFLAAAGFAVIGFTDTLNRELSAGISNPDDAILAQVAPVLGGILDHHRIPDFWAETRAEQIAFLRMFDGLGALDVLPAGTPDGVPELDVTAPRMYQGISEGANNGAGFLPYAPELRAAALVVGGSRLGEVLIHQSADLFLGVLGVLFPNLTPADIWVGVSLFQTIFDRQDPHNHAAFLYRNPVVVAGTTRKPSILLLEGLDDTLVPNNATESLAWTIGPLPHLEPVQRPVPFLETAVGPVTANIDADTSAAFYQYVPAGVAGIAPSPGCESQPEGHYCAQTAPASLEQRTVFFQSALEGAPVIIDPLGVDATPP